MRRSRSVVLMGVLALTAGLAGCAAPSTTVVHATRTVTVPPTAAPSATESSAPATPSPVASPSVSPSAGGALQWRGGTRTAGCSSNGGAIPSGAQTVTIADVDGDGQQDRLVLDDRSAEVGVLTHSGDLVMTRKLWRPGPASHSVAASYLSDGITALLSDDARTVGLGYFVDCGILLPKGVDGRPYTFALFGWGSDGTVANAGVRCTSLPDSGGQHTLSGVDLVKDGSLFRIRSTVVSTSNRGVGAVNGRVTTTTGAYGEDDATTKRAKTVDCAPRISAPAE